MQHDFQPVAEPWAEVLHMKGGKPVARLLCCGAEVHFEIAPEHRGRVIYRNVTREFLRPVFEKHGMLTTKTEIGDEVNARFLKRLGFKPTWSDDRYDYYMLTALPFEKKGT